MTQTPIHPAATVILMRDTDGDRKVLMGQRGAKAAFMPNKFVFPGGRLDAGDHGISLATPLPTICQTRLSEDCDGVGPTALATCAIRELWEETGLILGEPGDWTDAHDDWQGFAAQGFRPAADGLSFVFRAVTPPGRPRRFGARFFLADAAKLSNDPDDFTFATDELSHLQWVSLTEARQLNLPFITDVVLGELQAMPYAGPPDTIPYFKNDDDRIVFDRLGGSQP